MLFYKCNEVLVKTGIIQCITEIMVNMYPVTRQTHCTKTLVDDEF